MREHFFGVRQRGARKLFAAQHAGNFVHALLACDVLDGAERNALFGAFGDDKVMVGKGCHLRQMRDGHDLPVFAKLPHEPAHGLRHRAAHAGIDFIKNQCLRLSQLAGGHGNGQGNARQLAA